MMCSTVYLMRGIRPSFDQTLTEDLDRFKGGRSVELGPTGTVFSVPVSVTIRYSSQYLTNNGISDATTLKVVSMDSGVANETLRTISQDTTLNTVTAQTTHFSNFAVLGYTNATLSGSYGVT